jgi:hypothetical protein
MTTGTAPHRGNDDDVDGSTSWPHLPLALHASVVSRLWRPVPSQRVVWATGALDGDRTEVRWHSVGLLGIVGVMCPQAWPVAAMGHVEACSLLSRCQKFDLGLVLLHL